MTEYTNCDLDYKSEYARLRDECEKARCENARLSDELKRKEKEIMWLWGIKQTIEVVFGRRFE